MKIDQPTDPTNPCANSNLYRVVDRYNKCINNIYTQKLYSDDIGRKNYCKNSGCPSCSSRPYYFGDRYAVCINENLDKGHDKNDYCRQWTGCDGNIPTSSPKLSNSQFLNI